MSFKTTYFLFGILFGVLAIFFLTHLFGTRTQEQQTYVLPGLHDVVDPVRSEAIDRVEIVRNRPKEERIGFYKNAQGVWRLKQPETRADSFLVNRVIDQVINARRDLDADV